MAEVPQVEAPPVSAKVAGEVIRGKTTGEAGVLLTKRNELSASAVDIVSGEKAMPGARDTLFLQIFGETTIIKIDKKLQPLATQLDSLLTSLQRNVENATARPGEINAVIEQVILQTNGLAKAYENMDTAQKSQFIRNIRESGVIPLARNEFNNAVIGVEGNKYAAATTKYNELSGDLGTLKTEQTKINAITVGKDRAKATAGKDSIQSEVDDLKGQKQKLQERKTHLEQLMADREGEWIASKKSIKGLSKVDPTYKKWDKEIQAIDVRLNDITPVGIDGLIKVAEKKLRTQTELIESFSRGDALSKQIIELGTKVRDTQAEMLSTRSDLIKQVNELIKSLNGVMPEAAKKALNKALEQINTANTEVFKEKAKEAGKEGDILKGAEANLVIYLNDVRYVITKQQASGRLLDIIKGGKQVSVKTSNEVLIRSDFNSMFSRDGRGSANFVLNQIDAAIASGSGAGLSPEQIAYFRAHPDAKANFIEQFRSTAFKEVAKQAVMHLKLSESDLTTLSSSNDFLAAFETGVGGAEKARALIERASGAKIKGGTIKENLEKLAKPVLLGLILLALFFGIKSLTTS